MKALIVDDDRTLADLLAFTLRRAGFEPHLAYDAPGAMVVFRQVHVDIAILDVNMPGEPGLNDGFDLCREIRKESDIPIILLTVRDEEEDIIRGLNIGADDYILKPFSPRQLVARIETILRRASLSKTLATEPYKFQDVTYDPNLREFSHQGQSPIKLTRLEGRLLETLMLNEGQILLAENIIDHVWGPGGGSTEMLRQLVRRLRSKIEKDPGNPKLVENLPGVGYGFTR
ncbi:MAG: response regulator transcription factor [Chloroflexota bacterium]|nr:response regulator transcription factor [Chloroflexota bacterium]